MLECKTCKTELSEDQFYFRKDTQNYQKDCKKCQNKIDNYKAKIIEEKSNLPDEPNIVSQ
jgi:hypothetical protein